MNTIGNQTTARTTQSEANVSLKGTSTGGMSAGGRGVTITNTGAIRQTAQITGNMILSQMKPGTSFAGDIIDVCGNAIKLLLSGEKLLNATTTDARNLNIGDHIIFNVSSNNGSSVVIKPVKINHFNTNMLLRALEAAELPATEKNKNIVKAMMEHEMPIDKNSVTEMMKRVEGLKTDNPEYIVAMDKHGIPLTQENVEQFGAYKNYEHRIMSQAETIAEDIPQLLSELTLSGDESKAANLAKALVDILNKAPLQPESPTTGNSEGALYNISLQPENISDSDVLFLKSMGLIDEENGVVYESAVAEQIEKKSFSLEQVMQKLNTLKGEELKEFIESDDFRGYVKDKTEQSFFINLNRLSTEGDDTKELVKKLYDNLDKKTESMLQLLNSAGEGHSKLAQTATNIRHNMQFMQDLSQMASYVQLPVKFDESKAHGELYVYNRKKGMPVDKEVLTAFLHLDMDNLGATDIDVKMERRSVTIQFSLSDVEAMRIVEENLPMLKDRLEKKGYMASFTVDSAAQTNDKAPFDKVLWTDKPQMSIKRYSFDVRA